jgi:hypothetical protein
MRNLVKKLTDVWRKYTIGLVGSFVLRNSIRLLIEKGDGFSVIGFLLCNLSGTLNKKNFLSNGKSLYLILYSPCILYKLKCT